MQASRFRGPAGPQIHAVPDHEKAVDSSGRRLPWAYDTAPTNFSDFDSRDTRSRDVAEKGPFGKRGTGGRRGTSRSRSKTAEPQRAEDVLKREQAASEEKVFGSLRKVVKDEGRREAGEKVDGHAAAQATAATAMAVVGGAEEATEVLLYGFGEDLQWAAIDFYERASGGLILEDYDRAAPGQLRALDPSYSYARSAMTKSLSKASLRKKNKYQGGNYWIKVTFASREAGELACARSPHIIKGHLVYAEPWQGRGPARDEPIPATQAGAQIFNDRLPPTFSTKTLTDSPGGSQTQTLSSATAADTASSQTLTPPRQQPSLPFNGSALATSAQSLQPRPSTLRVRGAQAARVLPAELALMPKQPKQSWTAWLGASEVIGSTVPRRDDGSFDYARASLYWRLWYWVDRVCGTDLLGLKNDE